MSKYLPYFLAGFAFLGLTSHAVASPIGTANISNCQPNGGFTFNAASTITWLPAAGAGTGCIVTSPPTSITYSGGTFTSGTGTIENLPTGAPGTFMTLAGGALDFSFTGFGAVNPLIGVCSTTVALTLGQQCVISTTSPFVFTGGISGTSISFSTLGLVTDTGNASTSSYVGIFSTQTNLSSAALASTLDGGGSLTDSYSATLTLTPATTTPEPATFALLSTGVALLGGIGRKRFGKQ